MGTIQQTDPPPIAQATERVRRKEVEPRHRSLEMERDYLRALIGLEFRPVLGMVAITLSVGTVFYRLVEHWSLLDSLYFSVVTLATIGFGDIAPASRIGKIFTIRYVFAGVGTLGLFLSTVARSSTRRSLDDHQRAARRSISIGVEDELIDEVSGRDRR